jgi:hypothetical protein
MLTYDEIDNLSVGAEIDRLIAEKVMGQERTASCPLGDPTCDGKYEPQVGHWPCLPPYSTDIAAAWEVVEHLRDLWTKATEGVQGWDNSFTPPFDDEAFFDMLHRHADRRWPWAMLYVTPEAICKAALACLAE